MTSPSSDIDWSDMGSGGQTAIDLPRDLTPLPIGHSPQPQGPNPRAVGGYGFTPRRGVTKGFASNRRTPHPLDAVVGSVTISLAEIMLARGVVSHTPQFEGYPNLAALERGTGLSHNTVYQLLRKPETVQMVSLDTIARLCEFLHCQPGDIFHYAPLQRTTRRLA